MPKFPRNGMVIAPKTEHGMKARFRCKDGFELKGNAIVVCSFGVWSGDTPKCEEGRFLRTKIEICEFLYPIIYAVSHFPPFGNTSKCDFLNFFVE